MIKIMLAPKSLLFFWSAFRMQICSKPGLAQIIFLVSVDSRLDVEFILLLKTDWLPMDNKYTKKSELARVCIPGAN